MGMGIGMLQGKCFASWISVLLIRGYVTLAQQMTQLRMRFAQQQWEEE